MKIGKSLRQNTKIFRTQGLDMLITYQILYAKASHYSSLDIIDFFREFRITTFSNDNTLFI